MRRFLQSLLAYLARAIIRRQHPFIVGVTGSVGKTSTREAIRAVLSGDRSVRSAPKNYNNEIGFPVAIIGGIAPGRSVVRWAIMLLRASALALVHALRYPEALILEYGADHPGDIAYLIQIAPPTLAVVTAAGPAHTEFFGSVERVIAEKRRLIAALPRDGVAILNRDDENVFGMRDRTHARVVTYGFHAEADVRGIEYQAFYDGGMPTGIACKVIVGGSVIPFHLRGCLGRGHASAALAAVAVGAACGLNLVEISHALEHYEAPPGRLRLLEGVKRTILIDDSYNSSPLAVAVALEALGALGVAGRKLVVLGDMLELGPLTEHGHRHVGELVAANGIAYLVTAGEASRHLAAGARDAGMPTDRITSFSSALEAGRFVQNLLVPGDTVLIKGSQSMRMELIVKELMAEPLRAEELLCRQDEGWLQK